MGVRDAVIPQWPGSSPSEALEVADLAAGAGYRGLWFGETAGFDAGVLAGRVSGAHPDMQLFLGPLPVPLRTGPQLAMLAGSLASLGARAEIILGSSSPAITAGWHGRRRGSVRLMRDTMEAARAAASGQRTDIADGEAPTTGYRAGFPAPDTPIGLAALGPLALRLGGAQADRVVLNFVTPASAPALIDTIDRAAAEAGRARPALSVWMHTGVDVTEEGVRSARRFMSGYLRAPGYTEEFERQGFGDVVAAAKDAPTRGLESLCNDDLLAAGFALGSAEQARGRAAEFEALGLEVAVVPVTAGDPAGARTLEALTP
jgi:probable F420-dependent oxidoreductase